MSQTPMPPQPGQPPVTYVRPQANVYTVMLVVATLALTVATCVVLYTLLSPTPQGYGLEFGQLFESVEQITGAK